MVAQAGLPELLILMLIGTAILLSAAMFALWIYSLIHAIQNDRLDSTMKLVWILLIVFVSPIGSILYFVMGRNPAGPSAGQYYGTNYPPNHSQGQTWDSQ